MVIKEICIWLPPWLREKEILYAEIVCVCVCVCVRACVRACVCLRVTVGQITAEPIEILISVWTHVDSRSRVLCRRSRSRSPRKKTLCERSYLSTVDIANLISYGTGGW